MTRGPSLQAEPLLNTPSPHSRVVERLLASVGDGHNRGCDGRNYGCSCGYDERKDALILEAATIISELEARLVRLNTELDTANNNHRSMAHQLAETGKRALAAESSLHRVRAETVEAAADDLDRIEPYAMIRFDSRAGTATIVEREDHMTVRVYTKTQLLTAIRSLTNKTGENDAVTTAESSHSPSTREG